MSYNSYSIYNFDFIIKLKEILLAQPSAFIITPESSIPELTNYFNELLNYLNNKYAYLLNETDSLILKNNLKHLSADEKLDICVFFKIKSHFNPKLIPKIKNFCNLLDINKNVTLSGLSKKLLNSFEISSNKLRYSLKVPCANCKTLINVTITYLGSSNYSESVLHCPNCNHEFLFEVNNRQRENCGRNNYYVRKVNMTYCTCNSCVEWRNFLTTYICNNIKQFKEDLFSYIFNSEIEIAPNLSLEQLFNIHKNSLTKTENELLSLCPKSFEEINMLINEMNSRYQKKVSKYKIIDNLLSHGIIYKKINKTSLNEYIINYTNSYTKLVELINSNSISQLCYSVMRLKSTEIPPPYSIDYMTLDKKLHDIDICSIDIGNITDYHLNEYYFKTDSSLVISSRKYSIFNSKAELTLFNHLCRQYPNYIICPNVLLKVFTDIDELSSLFLSVELKYLKSCIIDFVIADIDGYVVKCIELQKGDHHNNKDWIYKDSLKRKCFKILGIDFSYEY